MKYGPTTTARKMIDKKTCRLVGTLAKTHGTRGSMVLRTNEPYSESAYPEISGDLSFVFFEVEGLLVPFKVVSIESNGPREMILTVEEVASARWLCPLGRGEFTLYGIR